MTRALRRIAGAALFELGLCAACNSDHDFIDPALFYADAAASPPAPEASAESSNEARDGGRKNDASVSGPPTTTTPDAACTDDDADQICNVDDRCPQLPFQDDGADLDQDGVPDACDPCGPALLLAKQPLFYFRFEEPTGTGLAQNLGSANPSASYEGPVALEAAGPAGAGRALHLPGQGNTQYPRVALTNASAFPRDELTVSFWLRTSQLSEFAVISYAVGADSNHFLMSFINQGPVRVVVQNMVVDTAGNITPQLANGSWHHILLTGQVASALRLHVDGELVDTLEMPPAAELSPGGVLIFGQEQDALNGAFDATQALNGDLDELAIYARAFSSAEVSELFAATSCCDGC